MERWPERFDEFLQTITRATNIQDKESAKQESILTPLYHKLFISSVITLAFIDFAIFSECVNESFIKRYKLIQKLLGPDRFTFAQFHAAHLNVVSRFKDDIYPDNHPGHPSWLVDDETCGSMAPIFDMVNHSADPNCFWDFDSNAVWITSKHNIPMVGIIYPTFLSFKYYFKYHF